MNYFYVFFITPWLAITCLAQYKPVKPVEPGPNEVAVTAPGSYAAGGTTYRLINDISSERSTVFLGKDVTLDLNGYTLRYAAGSYEHIPNSGFEEGDSDRDLTKAPGAKVVNTEEVHVYVGKKLMSLKAGDEIVSQYIDLPVVSKNTSVTIVTKTAARTK